ncbi:NAD-dependent malic enzyme, partial [Francisellaceae bacterium]|nr:NAD-dependent malic enzyme [Francisellaceae bacterium]
FYCQFKSKQNDLQKHIFLMQLHDFNSTAFYKLVECHLEEMLPIIYTPTVGEAVQNFSLQMRRPRGVYINYEDRENISSVLANHCRENIDFIIVTDGEAVLGIGDQGVGGMDISIGKLMVYILFSGLDPTRVLPVFLDVGTDNEALLADPLYIGARHKRIRGEEYDNFIDQFVSHVQVAFPGVFLHWEDFGRDTARKNLERYQDKMCTFNDDMQGTGIVTTANILSAVEGQGLSMQDQIIVMHGAGTASCGIADQICDMMIASGLSEVEARSRFWILNSKGLLTRFQAEIQFFQEPYVHEKEAVKNWKVANQEKITLEEVVKHVKPTILVGVSTAFNAFNETVVKEMARHVERPIIMPLSNPTSKSEAHPEDLIKWTDGKVIVATGSPFDPVVYKGKTYPISQGNNAYIFPGLGLGAIASKASRLTDGMIRAACHALSELSPFRKGVSEMLLPPLTDARKLSHIVAVAVAEQAVKEGVSEMALDDLEKQIRSVQWEAKYYPYKLV